MATVIDSLLIELGLDNKKFSTAAKKSVDDLRKLEAQAGKSFKSIQKEANNLGDSFGKAKDALLSLGVALVGFKGLVNLSQQVTDVNADIGRTASRFKMSSAEFSAWGEVMKSVGGTADDFATSISSVQNAIADIGLKGDARILETLSQLDIAGSSSQGLIKNGQFQWEDFADRLKELTKSGRELEALKIAQEIGVTEKYFQVLKKGGDEVRRLGAETKRLQGVNEKNSKQSEELQAKWALVSTAFGGAANQVMDQLYPALGSLAEIVQAGLEKFVAIDKETNGFLSTAIVGATTVISLAGAFRTLGLALRFAFGPLTTLITLLTVAFELFTSDKAKDFFSSIGISLHDKGYLKTFQDLGGKSHDLLNGKTGNSSNQNSSNQNSSNQNFSDLEKKYGLPDGMLDKIWAIESNRGKSMVSPAGATGHFQFMPATAKAYGLTREDTFDLNKSSDAAARMMSDLLKQHNGDVNKALASYNWGSGNVASYGMSNLPKETQNYLSMYHQGYVGSNATVPQTQAASNNNSTEVKINNQNIYTQATDANGIAKSMYEELKNNQLTSFGTVAYQ